MPVDLTHGNRLVWPEDHITKLDLARYCEAVGDSLLPHLKARPLTLVRCPDGIHGECFFQRHYFMAASPGNLRTFKRERGSRAPYMYVDSVEAIISTVQNGAVEFHTSGATIPDIAHPDRFTLDLDPGPGLPWANIVEAAIATKTLMDTLELRSFVKTSGGEGLHVVVPIEPQLTWADVKVFTHRIALVLATARPDLFLATMSKAKRTGKVFVDYQRNGGELRVAVSAYSPRARPGATVSTPIAWDELGKDDLRRNFTIKNVPRRVAKLRADPWREYWQTEQRITTKMRQLLGIT